MIAATTFLALLAQLPSFEYGTLQESASTSGVGNQVALSIVPVALADANGDGYREVVAMFRESPQPGTSTGYGMLLLDGNTLATMAPLPYGKIHPCPDLDGDGIEDFAITPHPVYGERRNELWLCSATGTPLPPMDWLRPDEIATTVLPTEDRDGDGRKDVLVLTETHQGVRHRMQVRSSLSRALLLTRDYPHEPVLTGNYDPAVHAILLDDLDRDGFREVAVAEPQATWGGNLRAGVVRVRSGADGRVIDAFGGERMNQYFGRDLLLIHDLDGDGARELAIRGPSSLPRVRDLRQRSFIPALAFTVPWGNFAFLPIPDIDQDGHGDYIAEGGIYSGAEGSLIARIGNEYGYSRVDFLREGADGIEFLIGMPYYFGNWGAGKVVRCKWSPGVRASRTIYRVTQPSTVELRMRFPQSEVGADYRVLASLEPPGTTMVGGFTLPLATDALLRQTWRNAMPWLAGGVGVVPASATATATIVPTTPAAIAMLGRTIRFAAVTHDASGIRWSSVSVPVVFLP